MHTFGRHNSISYYLSIAVISLYFTNISLAYISYQLNEKIVTESQEKYFLRLEKKEEQNQQIRKIKEVKKLKKLKKLQVKQAKKEILKILSTHRTGLNKKQLRQTAEAIHKEGKKYGFDPLFLLAIIKAESTFNNWAVSSVGARGLMQLMPLTAKEIAIETKINWEGKKTLNNPLVNVKMGIYYLDKMESKFGNMQLALEAYNYGPRKLNKWLNKGILPTRYSRKVFNIYDALKKG